MAFHASTRPPQPHIPENARSAGDIKSPCKSALEPIATTGSIAQTDAHPVAFATESATAFGSAGSVDYRANPSDSRNRMVFDWTITLGDLVQVAVALWIVRLRGQATPAERSGFDDDAGRASARHAALRPFAGAGDLSDGHSSRRSAESCSVMSAPRVNRMERERGVARPSTSDQPKRSRRRV